VHADWYLDYTRDWRAGSADFVPDDLAGRRVLDLACGYGPLSRTLAELGASVTAVDLSSRLLARAREVEARQPVGIRYLEGDAANPSWWDGEPFDGVVCNMALMDIDDLDGAMTTVAAVLKPNGWFSFSLFHPCFPGLTDGASRTLPSWPPDQGYAAEGWWNTGESGVRGHMGANHRMISTYLNAVLRAGLEFDHFQELPTDLPRLFVMTGRRTNAD
jgi:SAM-dependent methyltransferase